MYLSLIYLFIKYTRLRVYYVCQCDYFVGIFYVKLSYFYDKPSIYLKCMVYLICIHVNILLIYSYEICCFV